MNKQSDAQKLLDKAIQAYASKDFLVAQEIFKWICQLYPLNWTARYFYAMNLCALGDFSDARAQLYHIERNADDGVWQHVSRSGIAVVNNKEAHMRRSLNALLDAGSPGS